MSKSTNNFDSFITFILIKLFYFTFFLFEWDLLYLSSLFTFGPISSFEFLKILSNLIILPSSELFIYSLYSYNF